MNWIIGTIVITGLCLAMSESPWMPWPNIAGVLLVALGVGWLMEGDKWKKESVR